MPNRYPGTCYRCGEPVPAGAGVFEKIGMSQIKKWGGRFTNNKWLTQHHNCAVEWRGTAQHYRLNDLRPKGTPNATPDPAAS